MENVIETTGLDVAPKSEEMTIICVVVATRAALMAAATQRRNFFYIFISTADCVLINIKDCHYIANTRCRSLIVGGGGGGEGVEVAPSYGTLQSHALEHNARVTF